MRLIDADLIAAKSSGDLNAKSYGDATPAVANANAVWERFFGMNSEIRLIAVCAIALNSTGVAWPAFANAHAVFARSCGLKFLARSTASRAIAEKECPFCFVAASFRLLHCT